MKKIVIALFLAAALTVAHGQALGYIPPAMTLYDSSGNPYPNGSGTPLNYTPPPFTCYTIVAGSVVPCTFSGGGGSGTVTSVGLSFNADFTVTGSPVTTSGTLAADWATPPTGTGAMVRATSPVLVTPALDTPTSGVITNLTGTCSTCVSNSATLDAPLASPAFTGTATTPLIVVSGNGAASTAPALLSGTVLTGGTGTTNFPALFIQPTGTTAVTAWSTSGTGLGMNLASGFAGNYIDFHAAGAGSVFSVNSAGTVIANGYNLGATGTIHWAASSNFTSPSNGVFTLTNSASTGVTRINLGCNTTSCPGISVSGTTTTMTLGDGSAGGAFATGSLQPTGKYAASGQTSATTAQTLVTTTATSTYQINAVVTCDTSVAAATVTLTIAYTDPSSTAQTLVPSAAACTTLGAASSANITQTIRAKTGTTITVAAAISGSPNYDIAATALQITSN